jgi:phosphoglycerate dehydrogenase-like enzyme
MPITGTRLTAARRVGTPRTLTRFSSRGSRRVLLTAALSLCVMLTPARMMRAAQADASAASAAPAATAASAATTAPASTAAAASAPSAAELIERLGLHVAPQPVRERPGWRPPRVILVNSRLHELLPALERAAPHAKLIDIATASARDIAAADASLGVCSAEVLTQAQQLQWIQWPAAGVERCVGQPLVRERHPLITNLQRTMGPSMAEHVLALMFALSRHLEFFQREQAQAHWADEDRVPQLTDLEGKTVLVVGLGGIGTEVARRAHSLGMRVIATRARGRTGPEFVSYVGLPDELLKLAGEADFVVNCAPLTAQTTGIFNREFFARVRHGAYFISVGRGRSTVTADLIAALASGELAGAGLDVVDPEPLPADSPLWRAPNVIITPHISADTAASEEMRNAVLVENVRRYSAGEPMISVVDIERGY